jgi:hypothetical protein
MCRTSDHPVSRLFRGGNFHQSPRVHVLPCRLLWKIQRTYPAHATAAFGTHIFREQFRRPHGINNHPGGGFKSALVHCSICELLRPTVRRFRILPRIPNPFRQIAAGHPIHIAGWKPWTHLHHTANRRKAFVRIAQKIPFDHWKRWRDVQDQGRWFPDSLHSPSSHNESGPFFFYRIVNCIKLFSMQIILSSFNWFS